MGKTIRIFLLPVILISGCSITPRRLVSERKTQIISPAIVAKYSESPVLIDGKLDDTVWKIAPVYKLAFSRDIESKGNIIQEGGEVQVAWDEGYLYIGVKFNDSDIVQESDKDQDHHYRKGDLVEIFLKPEANTWYWEIYGTPNNKKTVFWFPGRGRLGLPGCYEPGMELKDILIATQIKGTLNNWKDIDEYWMIEMAIPVKELTKYGDTFGLCSN
ncbi:MAG: carbohydrate-binding family 9-like protein [bacterium]|nr:carbohydrate-binding family 9-like protein [bacterium]